MTQNEIDQMVQFLKANPEESWNPLYDAIEEFANQTKKPPISGFKGMEFIWVPPGRFTMGHPILNFYPDDDSDDEHEVVLTKGYYLSKYPITVAQYFFVTNSGASRRIKVPDDLGDFAVRNVNFLAAQEFCEIMSGIYVKNIFRLPTEAEWEYACRANMPIVTDSDEIAEMAWYNKPGPNRIGLLKPNAWGFHDMLGNVWEWCNDNFIRESFQNSIDPKSTEYNFEQVVVRGGSWDSRHSVECRPNTRGSAYYMQADNYTGFRVVMETVD